MPTTNDFHNLRGSFEGSVILPGDPEYDRARRVWNGAVNHRPAAVARPLNPAAVAMALDFIRLRGLEVSVLGGGYDWAGRSVRDGAVVIDLRNMAAVEVDATNRLTRVGSGATSHAVMQACGGHGLAAVAGAVGPVGMTGFTLGGGYGPLTPALGLGVDNLLGADIVLADGRILHTDAKSEPELFWAIRGGGGSFGVVTAVTLRLHHVTEVLAGKALYPWTAASKLIRDFDSYMTAAPDQLAATLALVASPTGDPAIAIAPCWQGVSADQVALAGLLGLAKPLMSKIGSMPPAGLFSLFEANAVPGRRYEQQTRWLGSLNKDVVKVLISAAEARTSPLSAIAVQSFHGVPTRVASDFTAFAMRRPHFLVSIVAAWEKESAEEDARHREWARATSKALEPLALPGGYVNLLGPDESGQLRQAFGANSERIRRIKQTYDPRGRFEGVVRG